MNHKPTRVFLPFTIGAVALLFHSCTSIPDAQATSVLNGIDVLVETEFAALDGLSVGLITNHTGQSRTGTSTIDLLFESPTIKLTALFSPEHGIRGTYEEAVDDSIDEQTGLKVYSLYGETRKPTPKSLEGLDALVFDIQDIGCRFYTYISTMGLAMEAAAENGLSFYVLDRANPINGTTVDGPIRRGDSHFIAFHDIPIRHGMTVGELAQLIRVENELEVDLTIVPLQNWERSMLFDETGLPWVNPSPNMRSLTQALLYPGIGLLETTQLSVGRGTDAPFEVIGAPYINHLELAGELNRLELPGIRFVPIQFTPDASKFSGEQCQGVSIILTDRESCPIVDVGIAIAHTLHRLYAPDFDIEKYDHLLRHPSVIEQIQDNQPWESIVVTWRKEVDAFYKRRTPYLLY